MSTKKTDATTEEKPKKKTQAKKVVKEPKAKKAAAKETDVGAESVELADEVASRAAKGGSFIPGLGRRKTSIARVRLIKNGKGLITINGRKMEDYFSTYDLRDQITNPLKVTGQETAVDVSAKVIGGGIRGQAEAVRLGLSRALIILNPTFRKTLKKLGYLTRDSRKRERKKPGLKSARRAPQWSKR